METKQQNLNLRVWKCSPFLFSLSFLCVLFPTFSSVCSAAPDTDEGHGSYCGMNPWVLVPWGLSGRAGAEGEAASSCPACWGSWLCSGDLGVQTDRRRSPERRLTWYSNSIFFFRSSSLKMLCKLSHSVKIRLFSILNLKWVVVSAVDSALPWYESSDPLLKVNLQHWVNTFSVGGPSLCGFKDPRLSL